MGIEGVNTSTLVGSREGVGDAERRAAGHMVRVEAKNLLCLLQRPTRPEQTWPNSPTLSKATRKMEHRENRQIKHTTQIFQYTQNKVAQPGCINHLLKKYHLLYCMNRLEEALASVHSLGDPCVRQAVRIPLWLLTGLLYFTRHDVHQKNRFFSKYHLSDFWESHQDTTGVISHSLITLSVPEVSNQLLVASKCTCTM